MKRTQKVIYALGLAFVASAIWGRCLVTTATACHATTGHAPPVPSPLYFPFFCTQNCGVNKIKKENNENLAAFFPTLLALEKL